MKSLFTQSEEETLIYDSARQLPPALEELKEVLRYRNLVYQLVRRDVVSRYKRSVLGVAWTMLNPLGMMIVLTLVFSQLFNSIEGYAAYVLSGLVAWNFFSQTTSAAIASLVWGGDFFRRIYTPRSVFAISSIGTGLVNLVLSLVPLLAVMLVVGVAIRPAIILSLLPMLLLACFSLGIGLLISSLAIYFPDVVEMYQIILTAWFYLTPIVYPFDVLPEQVQVLMNYNPMHWLVRLFRITIYEGRVPTAPELFPAMILSLIVLGLGWWVFARKSDEFAYRT
ncbi:MAG TPA: ABC transporter permease [Anaerolineaceae bacterium]|nr:ABC transporter permease [Anaerolineaceae bacterium]